MDEKLTTRFINVGSKLWKWFGIPLLTGMIGGAVAAKILPIFKGPDQYYIYVVGDFNSDPIARNIKDSFMQRMKELESKGHPRQINGVKLVIQDQAASEEEADKIAGDLSKKDDILLVIGHMGSTATKAALPHYLKADPPIAVIMPSETNPHLIPSNVSSPPVFQLSANDEKQADAAARFTKTQSPQSIWVVEDKDTNPVFSHFLAQEFVKRVHKLNEKGEVANQVLLWTTNREGSPSAQAVRDLGINWVFFAGSSENALILVRQIHKMWKPGVGPKIILSNYSATNEIISEGGDDMKDVYFMYPLDSSNFAAHGIGGDYWGSIAAGISDKLIEQVDRIGNGDRDRILGIGARIRSFFNINRVSDARKLLNAIMSTSFSFNTEGGEVFKFAKNGEREPSEFHVWKVDPVARRFVDVDIGKIR